jgi:hypothetical protein
MGQQHDNITKPTRFSVQLLTTPVITTHKTAADAKSENQNTPNVHKPLVLVSLDCSYETSVFPIRIGTVVDSRSLNSCHPALVSRVILAERKSMETTKSSSRHNPTTGSVVENERLTLWSPCLRTCCHRRHSSSILVHLQVEAIRPVDSLASRTIDHHFHGSQMCSCRELVPNSEMWDPLSCSEVPSRGLQCIT